jgi:hypothetical protein
MRHLSITLIDDVIRSKYKTPCGGILAAATLVLLLLRSFLRTLGLQERYRSRSWPRLHNRTMDRFPKPLFDSMVCYRHPFDRRLPPIITYSWPVSSFINFFHGGLQPSEWSPSRPSGLIASGFVQIFRAKNKAKRMNQVRTVGRPRAGDYLPEPVP